MTKIIFLDEIPKNIELLNQKNSKIFALNFEVEKYLRNKNTIPTDVSEWINWEDFILIDTIAMNIPMKWGLMKNMGRKIEFKGINLSLLETVDLNIEELEAIRLKDHEEMDQTKAAKKMNVSQLKHDQKQ